MKKIIVLAAVILSFSVAATAQSRSIGVRVGNGGEISYQHTLGQNFLEVDGGLGLDIYNTNNNALFVGATAIYNIMIAQPNWTEEGQWGFYAGPGANVGLGIGSPAHFNLAVAGAVGLEYKFWFPLQLSIDFRQMIGYSIGAGRFYAPSSIGLGVRYSF